MVLSDFRRDVVVCGPGVNVRAKSLETMLENCLEVPGFRRTPG